jgi:hypothetical protein
MQILRRIRGLFERKKIERAIDDELQAHLEMRTADNLAAGMPEAQARRDAAVRLGNPAVLKEQLLAQSASTALAALVWDARYALRQLARNRSFTLAAVSTLALGIGLSTAMFSILNAWILRPLPLKDPARLVTLWRSAIATPNEPAYFFNWRDYVYFRDHSRSFESFGASFERGYALTGSGAPQNVPGAVASDSLFPTLGVSALRGRLFLPGDRSGPAVAVISHSFWSQHFHQSPGALGETLTLNGKPYKIVGVLPSNFAYSVLDEPADAAVWTLIQTGDPGFAPDSAAPVGLVARLRPGVTLAQARSEMSLLQKLSDRRFKDLPPTGTLLSSIQLDNTRLLRGSLFALAAAVLLPDRQAEIALARSAAPGSISGQAEVMVLGRDGYKTAVKGTNGFLCIVERSWGQSTNEAEFWNPKMRAPHCFNAQAASSFAPIYLMKTKLVLAGKTKAEIAQAIQSGLDAKELPSLQPGAMAYMMSKQQYLNDHGKNWLPHVMFFSPGDLTKSWAADDPNSPVMVANDPQERVTILLVPVDKWSDGTAGPAPTP